MITAHDMSTRAGVSRRRAPGAALLSALLVSIAASYGAAASPPAGKAYVGVFRENVVAVVDTASDRVIGRIPVPPGPHGIVATPDGRKVYVSSDGAKTVSVIDTGSDRVVASIDVGATPHGLSISKDGGTVLVSGFGTNEMTIIDTSTDTVAGRIPVAQPHNSAIAPDGRTAYVASQLQGKTALVVLDLARRAEIARIPLDRTPRALSESPDGKRLYFTLAGEDAVEVLDTGNNRIVGRIGVGASPHFPLFTPDGKTGLVVSQGPGTLEILDPARSRESGAVKVGAAPHWIAASGDGRFAFVTDEGSNDVVVVDLERRTVTAKIPVGAAPRKIVFVPASTRSAMPAAADPAARDATGLSELSLAAEDYYFEPAILRGSPGQKLRLRIENRTGTLHNIDIPDLKIDKDIPPNGAVAVDVVFPPSGAVRLFCKFHRALGMAGELRAQGSTGAASRGSW